MTQTKIAAAREIAEKHNVKIEADVVNSEKRLKLLPNYIKSVKDETSEEQLKLKRVSDLIAATRRLSRETTLTTLSERRGNRNRKGFQNILV